APGIPHQPIHGGGGEDEFLVLFCEHDGSGCSPLAYEIKMNEPKESPRESWGASFSVEEGWIELCATDSVNIVMYDLYGRVLRSWSLNAGEVYRERLEGLSSGMYILGDTQGLGTRRLLILP
ncbi:MAG: T9SS type A sorting domain-containing protein, partial [Bacteroidia bacterium]|nr:T9SS type A sorting domain-containing protein [Bacteroidia bacterium]MDW8134311.1 T9SS type A sorting domain-containing protein [Bacteroidia bacterium]